MKYIFYILFIIGLSACTQTVSTNKLETKLIGDWKFTEAEFRAGFMQKKSVLKHWEDLIMTFKSDYSIVMTDQEDDLEYDGYWYISEDYEWNQNNNEYDTKQYINIEIWNLQDTTTRVMYWTDPRIGNNKLKVNEEVAQGKYKFELTKL